MPFPLWAVNRRAIRSMGSCRERCPSCSWCRRLRTCRACNIGSASPPETPPGALRSVDSQRRPSSRRTRRMDCCGENATNEWLCYAKVFRNSPASIAARSGGGPPAIMSRTRDALGKARKGIPSGQQLGNSDTGRRTTGALVAHSTHSPAISGQS